MPYKQISIDDAKAFIDTGDVTVADIRDAGAYLSGNIAGSINIQQDTMESFLTDTDKSLPLIVCCYHGHSSQNAAEYFSEQGFGEVYSVEGGYEAWRQKY